jgi:CRP/FNR family transcriptional regulator, cyclic AMP receptor protein
MVRLKRLIGHRRKEHAVRTLEGVLAKHPFFSRIDPRYHQLVVGCASNVRFNAGEFIFQEGREANTFYLIREGKVALEVVAPGHGSLTIETLGGGDMLGWSWLIPPYRTRFDARAVEMTRAIALDGNCLRAKCEEDHELGYELVKEVASALGQRLDATRFRLLDIYGLV